VLTNFEDKASSLEWFCQCDPRTL